MLPYTANVPARGNELDQHVNPEWMRVCKCMLPYLDRPTQKNLAISLKMLELVSVIQLYGKDTEVEPIPMTRSSNWEQDLLLDIKSNLSSDKAYMIDAIMKLGEFRNLIAQSSTSTNPVQTSDTIPFDRPEFTPPPTSDTPSNNSNMNHSNNTNSSNPADIIDKLSPLLDEKQRQMLKMFSALMGPNNSNS